MDFAAKMADVFFPGSTIDSRTGERGLQAAGEVLFAIEKDAQRFGAAKQKSLFKAEEVKLLAPVLRPNTIRDFSTFEENQSG